MPAVPDQDVATYLAMTCTSGVYSGPPRPPENGIPARAVFVFPTGGRKAGNYCGGVTKVERRSSLQIRVRGDQDDWDGGLLLARQVRDAIHHADSDLDAYTSIEVNESEPSPLGKDHQGLPEWSMNVEVIFRDDQG